MELRNVSSPARANCLRLPRPLQRLFGKIQRNHALEHATINLLTQQYPGARVMGISGPMGFALYSSLTADEVIPAVRQALTALQAGEAWLAVHENCGTNLVITAMMTTLASLLGLGYGRRSRRGLSDLVQRLPQVVLLNAAALAAAEPVARWVQTNWMTNPDLGDTEISSFFTDFQGGLRRVRVHTRQVRASQD
ncbi:MAG: DUF6391 domain-containing protein [Anaerolineae bacterium]|nr:DUF6391 domain-containing protein [Anaerolineae bacterium]